MSAATTEVIARAVILRDGQLLVARQRGKSWSFLPGGHVEPGDRVEVALVRELGEELGTEAKIAGFVGAVEHGYIEDGTTHHEINLVFEADITDTEPASQEDHLEFHWLPLDQLAEADVLPGALKAALITAGTIARRSGVVGTAEWWTALEQRRRLSWEQREGLDVMQAHDGEVSVVDCCDLVDVEALCTLPIWVFGGPPGTRTQNLRIKSPTL